MARCDGPQYEETGMPICPFDPSETDFECSDCWLDKEPEAVEGETVPNPGSDAAVGQGCLCSTSLNNQGQGFALEGVPGPSFVINQACKMHGWEQILEDAEIIASEKWGE